MSDMDWIERSSQDTNTQGHFEFTSALCAATQ
jgi:hypothetical protein